MKTLSLLLCAWAVFSWSVAQAELRGNAVAHPDFQKAWALIPPKMKSEFSPKTLFNWGSHAPSVNTAIFLIADAYDRLGPTEAERDYMSRNCRAAGTSHGRGAVHYVNSPKCRYLQSRRRRVSDRFEFSSLSHWSDGFAQNVQLFLTDPFYVCRRPALDSFFNHIFDVAQPAVRPCTPHYKIRDAYQEQAQPVSFDPARVVEVHYLLAAPGTTLASRFGHAMLRLVMCNEARVALTGDRSPAACRQDFEEHQVISYRALVTAGEGLSVLGAIGAKYDARLFLLPFSRVNKEYTQKEWRDLISVPLVMSPDQIHRLVHVALDQYWRYEQPYKFFSRNCATETEALLKAAFQNEDFYYSASRSPLGVLKNIEKLNLASRAELFGADEKWSHQEKWSLATRETMYNQGLLFASRKNELAMSFLTARASIRDGIGVTDLDSYLDKTRAAARAVYFKNISSGAEDETLHALAEIENHLFTRQVKRQIEALSKPQADSTDVTDDAETAVDFLELARQATSEALARHTPGELKYGLTMLHELGAHEREDSLRAYRILALDTAEAFYRQNRMVAHESSAELDQIAANIIYLSQILIARYQKTGQRL